MKNQSIAINDSEKAIATNDIEKESFSLTLSVLMQTKCHQGRD
jgi:hypothetical protein